MPFEHDGARLDVFLAAATQLSRRAARALIGTGDVLRNGQPVRVLSRTVEAGDVIDALRSPAELGAATPLFSLPDILFADGWVLVADKPAGVLSQPADSRRPDDLALDELLLLGLALREGRRPFLRLVHRLDRQTSGAVLFARVPQALPPLSEAWRSGEPAAGVDAARLQTWLEFREGQAVFEGFPFVHRLGLEFTLTERGIRIEYELKNEGNEEIPFGFGLHPYFSKLGGEDGTFVMLPAEAVMDTTADLLPTGRLIEVAGTIYDLRQPIAIGALDLDHVFTGIPPGTHARIEHRTLGISVTLEASSEFSHLVLYSPRGESYFCIENQTCSTDAHNLFDRGFVRESGLTTLAAGATHRGGVSYSISW